MPPKNLQGFTRKAFYSGEELDAVGPGLAIVLYTDVELPVATAAAADVLEAYLSFVKADAIAAMFAFGDDEYSDGLVPFDARRRMQLLHDLRNGPPMVDDDGYDFVLSGTPDGQAGDYGVRFRGTTVPDPDDYPDETSLLRLELPWNLLDEVEVGVLVEFVQRVANLFPFCAGHVGLSFINTVVFEAQARGEIAKMVPRLLGLDCAYDWMYMFMRGKAPPAHWIQLLDAQAIEALGGRDTIAERLPECELGDVDHGRWQGRGSGLSIRAAEFPPVGDVNRKAPDIGRLPALAELLKPIAYDDPAEVGLGDETRGEAYLKRFDGVPSGPWNNG